MDSNGTSAAMAGKALKAKQIDAACVACRVILFNVDSWAPDKKRRHRLKQINGQGKYSNESTRQMAYVGALHKTLQESAWIFHGHKRESSCYTLLN